MAEGLESKAFSNVEPHAWRLSDRVDEGRKARLLTASFYEIVKLVAAEAIWLSCRKKALNKHPGFHRVELVLELPPAIVDLFHNGAGGYRAQYYIGPRLGELANRHIIDTTYPTLRQSSIRGTCEQDFVEASLRDTDGKIWIHEGAWLSDNRNDCRNLAATAWERNASKIGLDKRFEASWAKLTPEKENRLEIKGGAVNARLESGGIILKPKRSGEIHEFGFT